MGEQSKTTHATMNAVRRSKVGAKLEFTDKRREQLAAQKREQEERLARIAARNKKN